LQHEVLGLPGRSKGQCGKRDVTWEFRDGVLRAEKEIRKTLEAENRNLQREISTLKLRAAQRANIAS